MEVSILLQVPPASPREKTLLPIEEENWVSPRASLNGYGEWKFHVVPLFETRTCPARSQVTIPNNNNNNNINNNNNNNIY